jgi:hypothetical protein
MPTFIAVFTKGRHVESILCQKNPVYLLTRHFFETHFIVYFLQVETYAGTASVSADANVVLPDTLFTQVVFLFFHNFPVSPDTDLLPLTFCATLPPHFGYIYVPFVIIPQTKALLQAEYLNLLKSSGKYRYHQLQQSCCTL